MLKFIRFLVAFVAVICALSFAAQSDIEESDRAEVEYCYNVAKQIWPDYQNSYKTQCEGTEVK